MMYRVAVILYLVGTHCCAVYILGGSFLTLFTVLLIQAGRRLDLGKVCTDFGLRTQQS